VQSANTAMVAPQLPPVRANGAATVGRANGTFPVFSIAKDRAELVLPTATLPKASGFGDTFAPGTGVIAVPVSVTGEPVTVELPVIATVPFSTPAGETGVNCTRMLQVPPAARVVPQAVAPPPALEYGPVKVIVRPVKAVALLFVSVKVWNGLVDPMPMPPNASEVGETLTPPPVVAAAVPVSVTGEPVTATLPVIASEPVTVPVCVVGANTTLIVQVPGAARVAPQLPPAVALANGPVKARALKVNVPVPAAVTVTDCDALVVPSVVDGNVSEVGTTLTVNGGGATPVPLSETGDPVTGTLAVMVAVPVAAPGVVGENTTLIVQVAAAASVAVQVPPAAPAGRENGAVTATAMAVAPAVPVLCRVSVPGVLVVPSVTLPNASGPPVTLSTAILAVAWNSTAPISNTVVLPGSGRGFPKKSVVGCV